jgi:hypothetical protein
MTSSANTVRQLFLGFLIGAVFAGTAVAKTEKGKTVDAGTFGVYVKGQRVATETFEIQQRPDMSVATSEFKATGDQAGKIEQKAELQILPNGNLRRYEWHEISPERNDAVVEPSNEFLIERVTVGSAKKPEEQPFILPQSTMILEDFFFSHREILTWRYLAQNCANGAPAQGCKLTKTQFGVIVPRQRVTVIVSLEYAGKEKVTIRGQEVTLDRFNLQSDGVDWQLFLDSKMKLVRVLIPAENTEVLRD